MFLSGLRLYTVTGLDEVTISTKHISPIFVI